MIVKRTGPIKTMNVNHGNLRADSGRFAVRIAVSTVNRFLEEHPGSLDLVVWVLFDSLTESVYEHEVDKLY